MFRIKRYGFINDTFGLGRSKEYRAWYSMISRCYNVKNERYSTYGARGVYVCEEWKLFSNFKRWYDENYIEGYQIDKDIKVPGNLCYGPEFCMFVSQLENSRESVIRRGGDAFKGSLNGNAKDKTHYELFPLRRSSFRRVCRNQGWNFNDFEEVFFKWYTRSDGDKERMFVYIERGRI
ncbi:MAG: hypothetical protein ACRCX7_11400 [Cetobacterium sp.]|uniref:hypothetical protein n=1 Tax=Cetobacterium sp. TaxID=2071632 RepID=UPI003F2F4C6B